MRNQIENAVAEFFIWQVPSILEDSTKDDSSSSEGEEDDDDDEKSEGEDTEEGGSHTEEAELDRKVPNGNRKCCNRWIVFMGCYSKFVFLSFRKERKWLKKLRGRKEKIKCRSIWKNVRRKLPKRRKEDEYGWDEGELRL